MRSTLFTAFSGTPTPVKGALFASILQNLTGGPRPMFAQRLAFGGSFPSAYCTFGSDGTVTDILNKANLDTTRYVYTIDGDAVTSTAINSVAQKLMTTSDANRLRTDGLRWILKINGEFKIPGITIHTLGDLFVPSTMEQVYQKRVAAKGNSTWLVQRAIRGASHCDFTVAEAETAFDDMIKWERDGVKPQGDEVVTPAVIAASSYGCKFTKNNLGPDDAAFVGQLRAGIAQSGATCPP